MNDIEPNDDAVDTRDVQFGESQMSGRCLGMMRLFGAASLRFCSLLIIARVAVAHDVTPAWFTNGTHRWLR
jgi:hypothetical protein